MGISDHFSPAEKLILPTHSPQPEDEGAGQVRNEEDDSEREKDTRSKRMAKGQENRHFSMQSLTGLVTIPA